MTYMMHSTPIQTMVTGISTFHPSDINWSYLYLGTIALTNANRINNNKILKRCLESIENVDHKNFTISVIDNNSSDDSLKMISENFPNVQTIKNSKNFQVFTGAGLSTAAGIPDYRSGANTVLDTGAGCWEKMANI